MRRKIVLKRIGSCYCLTMLGRTLIAITVWITLLTIMASFGITPKVNRLLNSNRHMQMVYNSNDSVKDHLEERLLHASQESPLPTLFSNSCVIANGSRLRIVPKVTQQPNISDQRRLKSAETSSQVKLIVRWTKFYGRSWGVPEGSHIFDDLQCPERRCIITDRKDAVHSAHAILVHMRDISDPFQLPKYRSPDQRWIFYNLESPHHIEANLTKFNGLFNWTSTYSSESDIPSPYGLYEPYSKSNASIKHGINKKENKVSIAIKDMANHAKRTRLGAWFVTNCKAKNNRKEYVEALQKNMMIDVYGFCGNFKCADRESCLDMLKHKYKFYIAFENSNCREYISEKFWYNALGHNILPVVMGAAKEDYERIAPPHSFIHVDDFPSARDLTRYLKLLHKDARLYNEYFRWKLQGSSSALINYLPDKSRYWCDLCKALHNSDMPRNVHWHLDKWWGVEQQCWP